MKKILMTLFRIAEQAMSEIKKINSDDEFYSKVNELSQELNNLKFTMGYPLGNWSILEEKFVIEKYENIFSLIKRTGHDDGEFVKVESSTSTKETITFLEIGSRKGVPYNN